MGSHRKLLAIVGAVAVSAAVSAGASAQMSDAEKKLYEAAKANNESVTWYISHYSSETTDALGRAFQEKYPGIKVNVIRTTAQVAFQRLSQDMKSKVNQCDVFSSTDLGHYSFLKSRSLLDKYIPKSASKIVDAFKAVDPDGYFHITSAGLVLINYNIEKMKGKELPKRGRISSTRNGRAKSRPDIRASAGTLVPG